jgi:hypothetical protein
MNMFAVIFKAIADLFRTVGKTATMAEQLVDQTTYGLVDGKEEAAAKLLLSRKERGISQADIDALNKDIFG